MNGIWPAQRIEKSIADGFITSGAYRLPGEGCLQPASLDMRLGERAYRLRASFLASGEEVESKLDAFAMESIDLRDGAILERSRPYLIPLIEELALPEGVRAKANPKSSTGRLDIFTRVVTDRSHRFDEIGEGYRGRLWLEVFSRSFTVKVQTGLSLNQLRLVSGRPRVSDDEVLAIHAREPVLIGGDPALADGMFVSLDLSQPRAGYRARKNSRLLDLTRRGHDPDDFWEEARAERGGRMVLEPEEFYLLLSTESVRIPPELAAEMTAYDPTSGELRTHYAGFFDPGFGHDPAGRAHGSRAVLEVRAHDVPFVVEHGQKVCRLFFERMVEPPSILYGSAIGSSYQGQVAMLSKHFAQR
jgi:dCTP deaminase